MSLLLTNGSQDLARVVNLLDSINPNSIALDSLRSIHASLWRIATEEFNRKGITKYLPNINFSSDFALSLQWFRRAVHYLPGEDSSSRSKCKRIIARCHLELQQTTEALEYAIEGSRGQQVRGFV